MSIQHPTNNPPGRPPIPLLYLPAGARARWILVPPVDRAPKGRGIHIARTAVAGCQTECGITLKASWQWCNGQPFPANLVCETCFELITHLNRVRGVEA